MSGEQPPPATPWYRQPLWLGVVGLALMIGGYNVSIYLPQADGPGTDLWSEVKRMNNGRDAGLEARLDARKPSSLEPPFRWPGRLMMLAGLGACVSAWVMMTRSPGRSAHGEQPAPDRGVAPFNDPQEPM